MTYSAQLQMDRLPVVVEDKNGYQKLHLILRLCRPGAMAFNKKRYFGKIGIEDYFLILTSCV